MLWELPNLTTVCLVVSGVWWFFNRQTASPRSFHAHLAAAALALLIDARRPALRLCASACYAVVNATPAQQFNMVLTLGAVVW